MDNHKNSSNKRRRLENDSDEGEEEVISLYSDSFNDGGNLSSNASPPSASSPSSPTEAEELKKQQNGESRVPAAAANTDTAIASMKTVNADKKETAEPLPTINSPVQTASRQEFSNNETSNSNNDHNDDDEDTDTDDEEEYCTTYRTVTVPKGVTEGQLFHVLITDNDNTTNTTKNNRNRKNLKIIGVTCPKGVKEGDTIIVVEPGCTAPLSPEQIAKINERKLISGIERHKAKWVGISFWKLVWPVLIQEGWSCTRESLYNFGCVTFFTPHATTMLSSNSNVSKRIMTLNQDYFETILGVLNYIKLFPMMKHLVDNCFDDAEKRRIKSLEHATKEASSSSSSARRSNAALNRWKYTAGIAAVKHSRVGSDYQVDSLPEAGSFSLENTSSENDCILEPIMDMKQNEDIVKPAWRELANDDSFLNKFHCKVLGNKKQFRLVATSIDMPIDFCMWYYYSKYKVSEHYQILKKLLHEESGEHVDHCLICDDGGDLICCESCPNAYHLECLQLNTLDADAEWYCPDCTTKRTNQLSPRRTISTPSPTKTTPNGIQAVRKLDMASDNQNNEGGAASHKGI
jgi:hypothetical protein